MGDKNYTLILNTELDITSIQKQIDELKNKLGNAKGGAGGFGLPPLIDATKEMKSISEIDARIAEISAKYKGVQVSSVTKTVLDENGNAMDIVAGKTIKYREGLNRLNTETYRLAGVTKDGTQQFTEMSREVVGSTRSIATWTDGISKAIQRTLQYATSVGLVYGALSQLKEGIQFIDDLNKEIVNMQVVTGMSKQQADSLSFSYNNLANQMGVTTLEVAKGNLEFLRQGKNAKDSAVLIQDSLMMSKLANMETADSTEKLTSIMNGYKLEAEDMEGVIDKLVSLDNAYATSVDEIATAMKYSSNSAKQSGIDLEHLAAYITVISSTTRMSAETIGQSFALF